ncbi:MAG: hypothetical protein EPGJADBJ_02869 [Saprospiraceae bacterium]|nr:hypothetical protein [Saprospiraceae bacterium]
MPFAWNGPFRILGWKAVIWLHAHPTVLKHVCSGRVAVQTGSSANFEISGCRKQDQQQKAAKEKQPGSGRVSGRGIGALLPLKSSGHEYVF